MRDLGPEAVERRVGIELGEAQFRPAGRRARDRRPVGGPFGYDRPVLGDEGELVAADQSGIEVVEQVWFNRTGESDSSAALLADRERTLPEPGGHEAESLGVGVEDP